MTQDETCEQTHVGAPPHDLWAAYLTEERLRRRAEDRLAFLGEANHLLAGSLDYETTLASLAHLLVPRLGDWCSIYLVEDQAIRQVAGVHVDPAKQAIMRRLHERYRHGLHEGSPALVALRAGRSLLAAEITHACVRANCEDDEHYRLLCEGGPRSGMMVPLCCRGRVLGVFSLVISESERRYGPEDLGLAEEIARSAALAIDNALLYRQAQEAIRAREDFLSIASHELRTPLNTLNVQLQVLIKSCDLAPASRLTPEGLRPAFLVCERQVRRLTLLLGTLFDISRLTAGRLDLQLEEFDLSALVREVVARFAEELAQAGCEVGLRLGGPLFGVWDRLRLDQVVANLLSNAMKYGAGKRIEIGIEPRGDQVVLTVADHGIGIAAEHQARIFERFERAEQAGASRLYDSLGLGLYIVRQILDSLGGSIRVSSEPARGSTFTVELPRGGPTGVPMPQAPPGPQGPQAGPSSA